MITTIVPSFTKVPNINDSVNFETDVNTFLNEINARYVAGNSQVSEINSTANDINAKATAVLNQAVDGGYSQSYINRALISAYTEYTALGGETYVTTPNNSNVNVYKNGTLLTLTTDYTLNGDGVTINFVVALTVGQLIQIFDLRKINNNFYTKSEINQIAKGFKNYIINGSLNIWQRGTNYVGSGYGASDRFSNSNSTDQQSKTIYDNKVFLSSITQSAFGGIRTRIENGGFILNAKTITLSFTYNPVSGDFSNSKVQFTVEGKTAITASIPNASVAGKKTITITIPNNTDVVDKYLEIRWYWNATTTTTTRVDIAEIQLEEGSVSTIFERRPYGLELNLCQRYFQIVDFKTGGLSEVNGQKVASCNFANMRTYPSIVVQDNVGNIGKISTFNILGTRTDNVTFTTIGSVNGAANTATVILSNSTVAGLSGKLFLDAEI